MADFFNSQMDYIFFFYGLASILLVPICHLLNRRSSRLLTWSWLGLFGAAHGLNEWLGLLTLGWGSDTALNLARLVLATGSFVFLVEFGRANLVTLRSRGPGRWVLAALLGVSLVGFFAGFSGFVAVSRYVLGFGGGLWAAGALYLASKGTRAGRRALQGAALGMLGYALTNLVVTPVPFFPAAQLNSESFLAMTGLPIKLLKGLLALWIVACLSILAQASLAQDTEHRIRVWVRTLIFGAAAAVIALLLGGWLTTQYFGDDATHEIRTNQESHAKVLYRAMIDEMEETDHLVSTLAGSLRIPPALKNWDVQTIAQANIVLDRYSQIFPEAVCYLMNLDGLTVASSNRRETDSFVGMSYRFRPYFQQAIQGAPGRYWALGVTSKKMGYYASYPVRDPVGKIVGVAVFKRPIGDLAQFFPPQSVGFIIDSHGIVFMANRPEMVLQSLWRLSPAAREQLLASRQFGPGPFTPILTREPVDRAEAWFQGKGQRVLRQSFPWEDWSMVILSPVRPIILGRLMGIAITLLVCLGVIAFLNILGLTIDTTARIQRSESHYRLVFQNNPVGIFHFDKTGTITDCNERFAEIIGAPKEKIIGFNMPRQLQNEKIREAMLASMKGRCGFYEGDYLSVVSGKMTSVRAIFQGILSPANEFLGGVGIFEDFTVRRQALEALRRSEEKFRLVFEKAPLGIMHYDQTSTITECNEKFAEIIGAPKEKFIGFNMIRQLHDEKMREAVATSLNGEVGYYEGDYLSVTAGKLTTVRAIFQPIFFLDGALSGGVTIFEDITDRKKAEVERLHFSKLESLGNLAGGIAHDFNNILTAILGNISLAAIDIPPEERGHERLLRAERACVQAQTLARQLLTFAKGGAPIKELISVENLVTETGTFACRGSKAQCTFSFPDNLWAIEADPGQITQVFQNLVINALQAMPSGGTIKVQGENLVVKARSDLPLGAGKHVKISIQDQGVGIPADHLARIFDPYFTTKQTGSGLGLATSYSIINSHHGHISVESTLGGGTTFHIYLPAVGQKIIKSPDKERKVLVGQGKILVMDDEDMVRNILGAMLNRLGYEAKLARDGGEAIELFTMAQESGDGFAAVILDLTIPGGMGGKETIEKLLKVDPQVKAIVSSGYSDASIMAEFTKYGFSGVIAKPYRISDLSKVLNKVIGREK